MGSRWVRVPVSASPYDMPEADGIIRRARNPNGRADLVLFAKEEAAKSVWCSRGAAPATGLLSRMVEKISGVGIVSAAASSKLALSWLKTRQGTYRPIAPGGRQDRRVQIALYSQGISGRRSDRRNFCARGGRTSNCTGKSETDPRSSGPSPQECALRDRVQGAGLSWTGS